MLEFCITLSGYGTDGKAKAVADGRRAGPVLTAVRCCCSHAVCCLHGVGGFESRCCKNVLGCVSTGQPQSPDTSAKPKQIASVPVITPHPSLTPHPSPVLHVPLTLHPSPLTTHPSPLTPSPLTLIPPSQTAPCDPPNISMVTSTADSITVSWVSPLDPNGNITSYTIAYRVEGGGVEGGGVEVVEGDADHVVLRSLIAFTTYTIEVSANTSGGAGPAAPCQRHDG